VKPLTPATGEIVEHGKVIRFCCDQRINGMGANKPGAAGYQDSHFFIR
jgi:hypothetical protein